VAVPRLVHRSTGPHPGAIGTLVSDFTEVVARYREARGIGVRALARAVHHDPSHLSRVLRGVKPAGPDMARRLDEFRSAEGEIVRAEETSRTPEPAEDLRDTYVAPELVGYFRDQLAGHYTADMYLGPRHLIPTVQTQAELIASLAAAADAPVRTGLCSAGSNRTRATPPHRHGGGTRRSAWHTAQAIPS
jgi:hypothetical protein